MPADKVIDQVAMLLAAGYPEIVLVGTHLGRYGADLPEDISLARLVRRLCELPALRRLRLSSIEPREVSDELIELVAGGSRSLAPHLHRAGKGKLCRHWHIPLQSGCDEVLARMGRPYDTALYRALITKIKSADPDTGIGADVIVGFPGETDQEFEETRTFIESLPVSYLHVFTYSPRPGTAAVQMPDQVQGQVKKERNHILRAVSARKLAEFARRMVGKQLEVVVERFAQAGSGELSGLTDNYLRAELAGPPELVGGVARMQVTGAAGSVVRGQLVS